jgi:hypothetical protein
VADGNLIRCRREGRFIYRRSQPETISEYGRALTKLAGQTKAASKN